MSFLQEIFSSVIRLISFYDFSDIIKPESEAEDHFNGESKMDDPDPYEWEDDADQ